MTVDSLYALGVCAKINDRSKRSRLLIGAALCGIGDSGKVANSDSSADAVFNGPVTDNTFVVFLLARCRTPQQRAKVHANSKGKCIEPQGNAAAVIDL